MSFLSQFKAIFSPKKVSTTSATEKQSEAGKRRTSLLRTICGIAAIAVTALVVLTVVAVTHGAALAAVPFIAKAIAPIAAYVSSNIPAAVGLAVTAAAVIQETAVPGIRNRPGLFMKAREEYRLSNIKKSIPKGKAEPVSWEEELDPKTPANSTRNTPNPIGLPPFKNEVSAIRTRSDSFDRGKGSSLGETPPRKKKHLDFNFKNRNSQNEYYNAAVQKKTTVFNDLQPRSPGFRS